MSMPVASISERLPETFSVGQRTHELVVLAQHVPAMRRVQLWCCGISEAAQGFFFVRRDPRIDQILITRSGMGRVLVNGRWEMLTAGMAYLTPRHVLHAYHALRDTPWEVCWAAYYEPPGHVPTIPLEAPAITRTNPQPLYAAILGLYHESVGEAEQPVIDFWINLVHAYVERHTRRWQVPDPIWQVWEKVQAKLAHPWTVRELAELAHISEEYLRRLCHRHYGQSPLKHVTYLRMRRAVDLLVRGDQKLDTVAQQLGYDNAFTFSRAFKRCMGTAPAHFRRQPS